MVGRVTMRCSEPNTKVCFDVRTTSARKLDAAAFVLGQTKKSLVERAIDQIVDALHPDDRDRVIRAAGAAK